MWFADEYVGYQRKLEEAKKEERNKIIKGYIWLFRNMEKSDKEIRNILKKIGCREEEIKENI